MATTATERVSSADAGGAPWESDSISTWTGGNLALVVTGPVEDQPEGDPPWPTTRTLTGNGQTWTEEATATGTNGALETMRLSLFSATLSSPSTGVLTAGGTGTPGPAGVLFKGLEVSEFGTGIVQVATNSGTGTTASVTLSSFADATNNIVILWVGVINGFGAQTISVSFDGTLVELGADIAPGFDVTIAHAWATGEDTTPSATLSASSTWVAIAVEVDSDAAPAGATASQTVTTFFNDLIP